MTPNSEQQPQVQQQQWTVDQHAWHHRERQTSALESIRAFVGWLLAITLVLLGLAVVAAILGSNV